MHEVWSAAGPGQLVFTVVSRTAANSVSMLLPALLDPQVIVCCREWVAVLPSVFDIAIYYRFLILKITFDLFMVSN